MASSAIQSQLDTVSMAQNGTQFGPGRYAYFFKPGKYSVDVKVGFHVQAIGLGQTPDDVVITGAVRSKADWFAGNATLNFWRSAENIAVVPTSAIDGGTDVWAVSQGTSFRRMHVQGSLALSDGGWSSGGFVADSVIDKSVNSGSQQQFLTRNDNLTRWNGANWNMVFVGDNQAPAASWPNPPYTVTAATPVIREKPFLTFSAASGYAVVVPPLAKGRSGPSWMPGPTGGSVIPLGCFYVAKPSDTAATMNAALAKGQHLLLTPGTYNLSAPLQVTAPGTIVMGLGLANLIPTGGQPVVTTADVDGVTLAGFIAEAGTMSSPTLVQVGPAPGGAGHAANPTALFDVHCRVGGADPGTADSCMTINENDVIIDNSWLWRADHGMGVGWTSNASKTGITVNGTGVTAYGLFVEHFQQYQTMWNANGGAVYMYQSEMPYDPPTQADWSAAPGVNGYASYKVASNVTTHIGQGLGIYTAFDNSGVSADNAIESPTASGITFSHMVTVTIFSGDIAHIINGTGGTAGPNGGRATSAN
jgi:hypothetical protein